MILNKAVTKEFGIKPDSKLHGVIKGMGLAPMAVLPDIQRRGIGAQLVNAGIKDTSMPIYYVSFVLMLKRLWIPGSSPRMTILNA
jgi:GNAT superfamily N-acetyltransferase